MAEKGKIRGIEGNIVIIKPDMGGSCFGCMNQECESGKTFIRAENPLSLPLETGQTVEVKVPDISVSVLGQTLAAFLPPALGFIAGFFLARLLFPEAGEGAFAGMGVIFFFATAFFIYMIRKRRPAAI
jgi:sigma-E factor negative regulatory protein RseC